MPPGSELNDMPLPPTSFLLPLLSHFLAFFCRSPSSLLDKKFFNKANRQVPSDYVIILDRSAEMNVKDTGSATNAGPPKGVGGAAAGTATGGGAAAGGRVGANAGAGGGATKFGFTDKQAKFEDLQWGMLPPEAKKAAEALGFNQVSWNEKEW